MKRILIALTALVSVFLTADAQKEITIKSGTIIPLQSVSQISSAEAEEGQVVDFSVIKDIIIDEICIIEKGTIVKGKVSEVRKKSVAGTKGKLTITISRMDLQDGNPLYFSDTKVFISGKNKTPVSVVAACFFLPLICITGTNAVMPEGYEVHAVVAANTKVTIK